MRCMQLHTAGIWEPGTLKLTLLVAEHAEGHHPVCEGLSHLPAEQKADAQNLWRAAEPAGAAGHLDQP